MRVLFIRSNPVNPDSRVEKEVGALLRAGYEVDILAWNRSEDHKIREEYIEIEDWKIHIYRIGIKSQYGAGFRKNLKPLIKFQIEILSFLKKNIDKYKIIHACDFDTAFASSKICFRKRKILVYDVFDYYIDSFSVPDIIKAMVELMDITIMNKADATIICTEQRKEQISRANPKKLCVIHNSPNQSICKNEVEYSLNKEKIKIAYVGVFAHGRGIEELCVFVSKNPDFELHIGGFGVLENIVKDYAKEYRNIIFYGKLPYTQTLALEKACDIITAIYDPSIRNHIYAAPNKFYEGLMLGKPIIMAKGTGMSDIVEKEKIGVTIDFGNVEMGLLKLKEMRKKWSEISEREKNIYNESYSWAEMERRLIGLYAALIL